MSNVRERIRGGFNRARMELELRRSGRPLITVIVGAAIGLLIALYIATHVDRTLLSKNYTVSFAVADATAVNPGSQEMRFKGVPVGVITDVEMRDGQAVITARYKAQYGRIYRNAQVQLRPNTALMDMYLNVVDRGTPSAGALSGDRPLRSRQTTTPVNVDDVLNVFKADVRERLAALLDNLGNGLRDRGARLRAALVEVTPLLRVAGRISDQIARRKTITRQLVHNTSVLMSALAYRSKDLRHMVTQGSAALSGLQSGSPDLAATFQELPPTLARLNTSFAALRGSLGDVDGAVRSLHPVADQLPAALSALRALNTTGAPAVRALKRPVRRLVPFSTALRPLSSDLERTVSGVLPQIPVLRRATNNLVNCEDGIKGFFQYTASLGKFGDLRGPAPRGNLVLGAQALSTSNPWEFLPKPCVPGKPVGGRVPDPSDMH